MCSRFELATDPVFLTRRFNLGGGVVLPNTSELRPTDLGLVVGRDGTALLRWGLAVAWDKRPVINARLESLDSRPTFRPLLEKGRVLVPATAWWEWREDHGTKIKTRIAPKGGGIMALAGLCAGERFVIVTKAAQDDLSAIHDRMPLVLSPETEAAWVDDGIAFDKLKAESQGDGAFVSMPETPPQGSLF